MVYETTSWNRVTETISCQLQATGDTHDPESALGHAREGHGREQQRAAAERHRVDKKWSSYKGHTVDA